MASGKTTLSLALGERLGWPVVDKDDINDVLIRRVRKPGPLAYEATLIASKSQSSLESTIASKEA